MNRSSLIARLCSAVCLVVCATFAGAEERIPWTTSNVSGTPEPAKPYRIERVYPNLQFKNPVELKPIPGEGRMLMLQVDGKLFIFDDDPDCREAELILDIGQGEAPMRAFGFGLHPKFHENRQLFVVYSSDTRNVPDAAKLSRFRIPKQSPYVIDASGEEILLTWTSGGHNGSTVHFDAEGLLYFSAGDGARPFPPDEYDVGQDLSDLRATICRIDVDHSDGDRPYRIPDDNPFVDVPGARGEIWAYGFRNPWRFTIDQPTGRLLCGDVGWELWESVFDVKRGGNYGWSIFEGPGALRNDVEQGPTPILKPLTAYTHSLGQSITGGIVYRGDQLPELSGAYLYGDYVSGLLWGLQSDGTEVKWNPVIAQTGIPIITFGHSADGEALVVSYTGEIYQLVRNPMAGRPSTFPTQLSEAGLFDSLENLSPAAGVYPYELAAVSVHEGVTRRYHVGVPEDGTIKVGRQKRNWKYPVGTVFARTLSKVNSVPLSSRTLVGETKVETQILHFDGLSWQPYSYIWNEAQDEATLLAVDGESQSLDPFGFEGESWPIHARAQCRSCHTNQAGGAVGFSLENLSDAAINHFVDLKILDQRGQPGWKIRKMVSPSDESADLESRARSYLAANCAHCHRRGGGGSVALDLEYSNPSEAINAIGTPSMQGNFEIDHAKVVAPGDPYRSVMLYRMATSGVGRMPKLSHHDPDPKGLLLVRDWIRSLKAGPTAESLGESQSKTSRALKQLVNIVDSGRREDAVRAARRARESGDVLIEGLFERFLPAGERRQQLGPNIDPAKILAMTGDVGRGQKWLTESRGAQCIACHRIGGQGHNVGPSFDSIGGKRTPSEILTSIIDPSEKIEAKYQTRAILTDDGTIVTGLLISDNEQSITVRSSDGKDHQIDHDSIETQRVQPQSLMPSGQAETMTARELADLIAYLSSLK